MSTLEDLMVRAEATALFLGIMEKGKVELNEWLSQHGLPDVEHLPPYEETTEHMRETILEGLTLSVNRMMADVDAIPDQRIVFVVRILMLASLRHVTQGASGVTPEEMINLQMAEPAEA